MPDLLVRLYDLPEFDMKTWSDKSGVIVRRAIPPERRIAVDFAGGFSDGWAAECEMAFSAHPVPVWIAVRGNEILGFACHDATAKGFFGPTGVLDSERGKGVGRALLMATLCGLREAGYAYGIIGGVEDALPFYRRCLDCLEIPGSTPGVYAGMLTR